MEEEWKMTRQEEVTEEESRLMMQQRSGSERQHSLVLRRAQILELPHPLQFHSFAVSSSAFVAASGQRLAHRSAWQSVDEKHKEVE